MRYFYAHMSTATTSSQPSSGNIVYESYYDMESQLHQVAGCAALAIRLIFSRNAWICSYGNTYDAGD